MRSRLREAKQLSPTRTLPRMRTSPLPPRVHQLSEPSPELIHPETDPAAVPAAARWMLAAAGHPEDEVRPNASRPHDSTWQDSAYRFPRLQLDCEPLGSA